MKQQVNSYPSKSSNSTMNDLNISEEEAISNKKLKKKQQQE
jgi:hypothetical protein